MAEFKKTHIPLGVVTDSHHDLIGIFARTTSKIRPQFNILWGHDTTHFSDQAQEVVILLPSGKKENPKLCSHFKFLENTAGYITTYIRTEKNKQLLIIASGSDLAKLQVTSAITVAQTGSTLVETKTNHGNYILYRDDLFARLEYSHDLYEFNPEPKLLFTSKPNSFDAGILTLFGSVITPNGILILYDASGMNNKNCELRVGAILFDSHEPSKILWRSDTPIWTGFINIEKNKKIYPLGISTHTNQKILSLYWASEEGEIITVTIKTPFIISRKIEKTKSYLNRSLKNPILEPKNHNDWESEAVFNPAAVYENGKVHMFYRAIGREGISVLGYASSKDGVSFSDRLDQPVYEPHTQTNLTQPNTKRFYNPLIYTSGGGWSGYEDPRAVKIGHRIYLTYLSFGGWDSMRIAITSINEKDLNNHVWKWKKPVYISAPGQVNKNWVLFPEKIHGKFAILHSITPKISIDYRDSLEEFDDENFIKSHAPHGGRTDFWDTKVRGVGPPPLKTPAGWLILYHANDMLEPQKYKLGAMILDSKDPQKILYRTSQPILAPDMPYENNGKPGVVYASGAIIKDDKLFVYYGGADKVVCVASTPLEKFLESVKKDKEFHFVFEPKNSLIT